MSNESDVGLQAIYPPAVSSEKRMSTDAQAALDYLKRTNNYDSELIDALGLSDISKEKNMETEEEKWNREHGRTAKCKECGGAMKDDGREFCSWNCWRNAGGANE